MLKSNKDSELPKPGDLFLVEHLRDQWLVVRFRKFGNKEQTSAILELTLPVDPNPNSPSSHPDNAGFINGIGTWDEKVNTLIKAPNNRVLGERFPKV
jgi:hypothetical protein